MKVAATTGPKRAVLAIGAVYLLGALELRRFRQASTALAQQLAATPAPPPALGPWLASLPPSLCNAVRLRIDGLSGLAREMLAGGIGEAA